MKAVFATVLVTILSITGMLVIATHNDAAQNCAIPYRK